MCAPYFRRERPQPPDPVERTLLRRAGAITLGAAALAAAAWASPAPVPSLAEVSARLGDLAVPFEANQGQLDPAVAYAAHTFYGTTYVTREGELVHVLAAPRGATPGRRVNGRRALAGRARAGPGWSLVERLVGGARLAPRGEAPSPTRVSRFVSNDPSRWRRGLPTFRRVALGQVWPGIEVDLAAHGANVEKIFTVAPGADPGRIEVGLDGALALRLDIRGALVAETGNGPVHFAAPRAYQVVGGERRAVAVRYLLDGAGRYSFVVGDHDPGLSLTIDPLLQATYLGGGDLDEAEGVAIDGSGHVIVVGMTRSADFPGTTGGVQASHASDGGVDDVFVASLTRNLRSLEQATYLGGGDDDGAFAVAIGGSGEVIVTGRTLSTDFPGTLGGAQPAIGGFDDAFVARLSADLQSLEGATYLGGGASDEPRAVAVHGGGDVIVVGSTESTDFPGTTGGAQATPGGGSADGFVARLSPDLGTLVQATYLGGSSSDSAGEVAIGPGGDVLVAGGTLSTDFPGTAGGAQGTSGGSADGFVARLPPGLGTLDQATYLGGSGADAITAMALDGSGDVLVAGFTFSTDFPRTAGGAQPAFGGGEDDAYVARLTPDLSTLDQATYLGGAEGERGVGVTIGPSGAVLVAGVTFSIDFPGTDGGAQATYGGGGDSFVARLRPDLGALDQATYLGGGDVDEAAAMTIDGSGNVIVVGLTRSTDFPGTTGGAQTTYGGGIDDAFAARLTPDLRLVTPAVEVPALDPEGLVALALFLALAGALSARRVSP